MSAAPVQVDEPFTTTTTTAMMKMKDMESGHTTANLSSASRMVTRPPALEIMQQESNTAAAGGSSSTTSSSKNNSYDVEEPTKSKPSMAATTIRNKWSNTPSSTASTCSTSLGSCSQESPITVTTTTTARRNATTTATTTTASLKTNTLLQSSSSSPPASLHLRYSYSCPNCHIRLDSVRLFLEHAEQTACLIRNKKSKKIAKAKAKTHHQNDTFQDEEESESENTEALTVVPPPHQVYQAVVAWERSLGHLYLFTAPTENHDGLVEEDTHKQGNPPAVIHHRRPSFIASASIDSDNIFPKLQQPPKKSKSQKAMARRHSASHVTTTTTTKTMSVSSLRLSNGENVPPTVLNSQQPEQSPQLVTASTQTDSIRTTTPKVVFGSTATAIPKLQQQQQQQASLPLNTGKNYSCRACQLRFSRVSALAEHYYWQQDHNEEYDFPCQDTATETTEAAGTGSSSTRASRRTQTSSSLHYHDDLHHAVRRRLLHVLCSDITQHQSWNLSNYSDKVNNNGPRDDDDSKYPMEAVLLFDGKAKPNPGIGGSGYVLKCLYTGTVLKRSSQLVRYSVPSPSLCLPGAPSVLINSFLLDEEDLYNKSKKPQQQKRQYPLPTVTSNQAAWYALLQGLSCAYHEFGIRRLRIQASPETLVLPQMIQYLTGTILSPSNTLTTTPATTTTALSTTTITNNNHNHEPTTGRSQTSPGKPQRKFWSAALPTPRSRTSPTTPSTTSSNNSSNNSNSPPKRHCWISDRCLPFVAACQEQVFLFRRVEIEALANPVDAHARQAMSLASQAIARHQREQQEQEQ